MAVILSLKGFGPLGRKFLIRYQQTSVSTLAAKPFIIIKFIFNLKREKRSRERFNPKTQFTTHMNVIFIVLLCCVVVSSSAFLINTNRKHAWYSNTVSSLASSKDNVLFKALFNAAELFGNINSGLNSTIDNDKLAGDKALTVAEVTTRVQDEYEKIFWVTGKMDMSLYESNCTFADPFSSCS